MSTAAPYRWMIWLYSLVGLCSHVLAQPGQAPIQGVNLRFDRQNNFTYGTRLDVKHIQEGKRYEWNLDFHHDNLFNTAQNGTPLVQLLVNLRLWQHYQFNPKWAAASFIELDQFWSTRNQRYSGYAGVRYRPIPGLEITPLLGYSWDYRQQTLDQGISPALAIRSQQQLDEGLFMQTYLWARAKYIQPRHQRNVHFTSDWARIFDAQTGLNIRVQGGSNQMDDYKGADIERIKSDTIMGVVQLQYPLGLGITWQSSNRLGNTWRRLDYDPLADSLPQQNDLRFRQLDFETRQEFSFAKKKWQGKFVFEYQSLTRGYELENSIRLPEPTFQRELTRERQKDFFRRLTNLELLLTHRPNPRHRYTLTGTNRYLMYDTPSEVNFDDHDELNYGLSAEWQADWSRNLMTRYRLLGSVRRYAFLLGERSQDNYTQRNLRLDFFFRWNVHPQLLITGESFVYVTYNVKDFTDRNLTDRSTRNLEHRLNMRYRPAPKLDMELSFYRKETHVSYLNWEAFTETTLDTNTLYILDYKAHWQVGNSAQLSWRLSAGYRHFSQLRYLNTAMISFENILTPINLHIRTHQTGPSTGIRLLERGGSRVEASVWWQIQVQDFKYKEVERFTTLSTNYRQSVLDQSEITLRPFWQLTLNWLLGQGRR